MTKNNLRIISKPHAYHQITSKTPVKFQKNHFKTVGGVAHTRYILPIHYQCKKAKKMTKLNLRKSDKNNLRIIPKPHAYLQNVSKTPVKFLKYCYKTVGGVAHTRYLLSIHFYCKIAQKVTKKVQVGKDQEKAQSEKDSHSKNRGGKKTKLTIRYLYHETYRKPNEQLFSQ